MRSMHVLSAKDRQESPTPRNAIIQAPSLVRKNMKAAQAPSFFTFRLCSRTHTRRRSRKLEFRDDIVRLDVSRPFSHSFVRLFIARSLCTELISAIILIL